MKERLELLIADLRDDLKTINRLKSEYDNFIKSIGEKEPDIYQRAVIGFYLHNFYNVCENIFVNIAGTFENNIESDTWHKSVLKRMKQAIDGIRPQVISDSLYKILDDFRAFRHVFRHMYSYEIDWEKEKIVAGKFDLAVKELYREINQFIDFLKKIQE